MSNTPALYRKRAQLTQEQLAKAAGMSVSYLQDFEAGRRHQLGRMKMIGYKLTNPNGTVYGIFNCKAYANAVASQHFMQRASILTMEEIEMPIFEPLYYEFMDASGEETDYESPSKKQLEDSVEVDYEGDKSWAGGHTIAFGYDIGGNECFLIEEAK